MKGLCSHLVHMWATSDFIPVMSIGAIREGRGYVSNFSHIWATSDFLPVLSIGDPKKARVMSQACPHVGHFGFSPHAQQ